MSLKVILAGAWMGLLAGCGGGGGGGTGGAASGGSCVEPVGIGACSGCADQTDCQMCASTVDQAGVTAYNALTDCLFCTACYTACDGASFAGCTSGPPSSADACNMNGPDAASCNTCQTCATESSGTCAGELSACKAIDACVDLVENLSATCSSLPM